MLRLQIAAGWRDYSHQTRSDPPAALEPVAAAPRHRQGGRDRGRARLAPTAASGVGPRVLLHAGSARALSARSPRPGPAVALERGSGCEREPPTSPRLGVSPPATSFVLPGLAGGPAARTETHNSLRGPHGACHSHALEHPSLRGWLVVVLRAAHKLYDPTAMRSCPARKTLDREAMRDRVSLVSDGRPLSSRKQREIGPALLVDWRRIGHGNKCAGSPRYHHPKATPTGTVPLASRRAGNPLRTMIRDQAARTHTRRPVWLEL
jgi:hypothetical protein